MPKRDREKGGEGHDRVPSTLLHKSPPSPPTHTLLVLATYNVLLLLGLSPRLEKRGGDVGGARIPGEFSEMVGRDCFSFLPPSSVPQLLSSPACGRIHQFKMDLNARTEVRFELPSWF